MGLDTEKLRLTDFLDLSTLQEIQDSFTAVAGVKAIIADADGKVLTQAAPTAEFLRRQRALSAVGDLNHDQDDFVAPIVVNDRQLGTLRMSINGHSNGQAHVIDDTKTATISRRFNLKPEQVRAICEELSNARSQRPAAIQFLFLMANAIAALLSGISASPADK